MFDEEPMFDNTTEKHQNYVKAPSRLQSSVYPGKSRKRDYRTSQRPPIKDSLQKSGRNGHHGSTSLNENIDKCTRNGYGNVYESEENWSTGSSSNGNGLVNDNNHYIFGAFSSVIYGNGDRFQTHSEFDRSSVISQTSDGFLNDSKPQPWMNKVTGGTFRKEYLDKNLFRPTLQHDSSIPLQNVRRIGFIENRSVETQTQDPYINEERNDKRTIKTGLVVILGILLIACIAGILTWFLTKKGDDEFSVKYYIVSGEMALINEFYPELSNSSSKEFKDLVIQFCGAITDALGKNNTEYGHLYRHCDVTKFMNGSIVAQYKLYYQYDEIPITNEKVYQDLKDSLTDIDFSLANFSDFVIIKASVSFLVEVQTFQTDPFVTGVPLFTQATATTVTERKTTAMSSNFTTLLTESTTAAITTEYTTESIPITLASEITTESDLSTFTTEDTTENTQSSLITEVPKEDTTYSHSTEARIETSQSFTETVTDQTSTALNTREDSTPIDTTEYQTESKTMVTSEYPTTSAPTYTTERFAQTTTMNKTEISIPITTLTNFETSESLETTSTTFLVTSTSAEYSADVVVSPIIAIYGEITTTKTCVVSPHGDWVHVTVSVENRNTSYVIGKYYSNRTFEEPAFLERFNASISSTDSEIVVYLSLDLQAPTTDMCSWDGTFTFSCSITMNDTISTRVYNGSQVFITAPMSETRIDSEVHYNEGDILTFNCSSNGDPNYSSASVELIKDFQTLLNIPGPYFGLEYKSNCSVDFNWIAYVPNPLTINQHDVIVRCVVKNSLLNEIRTSEKKLNVSAVDVAFETYKLESSIGSQVSVKCIARNTNSIKAILMRKIENSLNHTVANITLPNMTSHVDGTTVSYTNNSLMLTFSSLTCHDDGQYTCIVIKEDDSQIESHVYLQVKIKNPPKHDSVIFTLHPNIRENTYVIGNVHTCMGDVGYPSGLSYLSLKFTHPITNASFTYDEMSISEDMKTSLSSPLKFQVSLASGLNIIIVEDDEPDSVNCTRKKEIKFLLEATRDWNKAKIRCSVVSEGGEVNATAVEEEMYVIPDAICNGSNGSDVYVPHEKIDGCKSYVRCYNNIPSGHLCGPQLCFDHQQTVTRCNWCIDVSCESEIGPTTEAQITTLSSTQGTPEIQCPLLSCNSSLVFEMETGNIVCEMNTSITIDNITVMTAGQTLMTVYPNGTNNYFSDEFDKYQSTIGTIFTFGIKNVSCRDKDEYTFTVNVGDGGRCSKTASLDIKAESGKPTLVIDYSWTEGTNNGNHYCIGDVGNPPGTMTLEIKDVETGNFTSFSPSTQTFSHRMENCTNDATLSFSIDFKTNNITGYYIRCVVATNQLQSPASLSFSDEIRISPLPENACYEDGVRPYPGDCTRFLNCANNRTYVTPCSAGFCFSALTCIDTNCDSICNT